MAETAQERVKRKRKAKEKLADLGGYENYGGYQVPKEMAQTEKKEKSDRLLPDGIGGPYHERKAQEIKSWLKDRLTFDGMNKEDKASGEPKMTREEVASMGEAPEVSPNNRRQKALPVSKVKQRVKSKIKTKTKKSKKVSTSQKKEQNDLADKLLSIEPHFGRENVMWLTRMPSDQYPEEYKYGVKEERMNLINQLASFYDSINSFGPEDKRSQLYQQTLRASSTADLVREAKKNDWFDEYEFYVKVRAEKRLIAKQEAEIARAKRELELKYAQPTESALDKARADEIRYAIENEHKNEMEKIKERGKYQLKSGGSKSGSADEIRSNKIWDDGIEDISKLLKGPKYRAELDAILREFSPDDARDLQSEAMRELNSRRSSRPKGSRPDIQEYFSILRSARRN